LFLCLIVNSVISLNNLPDEVIERIFTFINDPHTAVQLSRLCKKLYSTAHCISNVAKLLKVSRITLHSEQIGSNRSAIMSIMGTFIFIIVFIITVLVGANTIHMDYPVWLFWVGGSFLVLLAPVPIFLILHIIVKNSCYYGVNTTETTIYNTGIPIMVQHKKSSRVPLLCCLKTHTSTNVTVHYLGEFKKRKNHVGGDVLSTVVWITTTAERIESRPLQIHEEQWVKKSGLREGRSESSYEP